MGTFGLILLVVIGGFIALMIGMQWVVRAKAKALQGTPVPELPGGTGKRIQAEKSALLYFFSPQCGACRAITPRVRELSKKNRAVFAIDVMQDMGIAGALRVMATPSTIEIADGRIVGYHIGPIPPDVVARFTA